MTKHVRWEYTSTGNLSDNNLSSFGAEGWELVCIIHNNYAIFKRKVSNG